MIKSSVLAVRLPGWKIWRMPSSSLGPVRSLEQSVPPAKLYRDAPYLAELERRNRIQAGFNSDDLQRLKKRLPKPRRFGAFRCTASQLQSPASNAGV